MSDVTRPYGYARGRKVLHHCVEAHERPAHPAARPFKNTEVLALWACGNSCLDPSELIDEPPRDAVWCKLCSVNARREPPCVYFALSPKNGLIKIGWSTHVVLRMEYLGCELLATIAGGMATEAWMHERFASSCVRGEWFRPSPDLLGFVAALAGADVAAEVAS